MRRLINEQNNKMITDIDIDREARVLIDEYGAGALMEAMNRLEKYLTLRNNNGIALWQRITDTVETLQTSARLTSETFH